MDNKDICFIYEYPLRAQLINSTPTSNKNNRKVPNQYTSRLRMYNRRYFKAIALRGLTDSGFAAVRADAAGPIEEERGNRRAPGGFSYQRSSPSCPPCFLLRTEPAITMQRRNPGGAVVFLAGDVIDALAGYAIDVAFDVATRSWKHRAYPIGNAVCRVADAGHAHEQKPNQHRRHG